MRKPRLESKAAEIMRVQYKQSAFEKQEMSRPACRVRVRIVNSSRTDGDMENSQTGTATERMRTQQLMHGRESRVTWWMAALSLLIILGATPGLIAQQSPKQQWKTLPFAIVRYNDDAPKSWNVYRGERKGIYLVRLWKRYLLVDTDSQSVFEIDPEKVKGEGDKAELAAQDIPEEPVETSEWKTRNAGPVLRHRFRFGKSGNFMELQIPVLPNGRPAY
jgi:hypothetical protein